MGLFQYLWSFLLLPVMMFVSRYMPETFNLIFVYYWCIVKCLRVVSASLLWHSLNLQAVWALGNVAGDSPRCRDLVLSSGALIPLLAQLNEHSKLSMLRNATWTLSNFCRGKPQPPFEQVSALIYLCHCLNGFKTNFVETLYSEIPWIGEASSSCTWTSCSFKWWRSIDRCLLGTFLPIGWTKWQDSSCDWGRCMPKISWAPHVCTLVLLSVRWYILSCAFSSIYMFFCLCPGTHLLQCWFPPSVQLVISSLEMIHKHRLDFAKSTYFLCMTGATGDSLEE